MLTKLNALWPRVRDLQALADAGQWLAAKTLTQQLLGEFDAMSAMDVEDSLESRLAVQSVLDQIAAALQEVHRKGTSTRATNADARTGAAAVA